MKRFRYALSALLFRLAFRVMPPTNYTPPIKVVEEKIVKGYGA